MWPLRAENERKRPGKTKKEMRTPKKTQDALRKYPLNTGLGRGESELAVRVYRRSNDTIGISYYGKSTHHLPAQASQSNSSDCI